MRLIDADNLRDRIINVCDAGGWLEPVTSAIREYFCKQIDAQETASGVEIVQCKECVYYDKNEWWCRGTEYIVDRKPDEFCNRGKKED